MTAFVLICMVLGANHVSNWFLVMAVLIDVFYTGAMIDVYKIRERFKRMK